MDTWTIYLLLYTFAALYTLWFSYAIVFLSDADKKRYPRYHATVSIILPTYNEENHIIERTIKHACLTNAEVIVIDDGSPRAKQACIRNLPYNFTFFCYQKNKGKRHAQSIGFRAAKGDILVTLDSDTIITQRSIDEILKPFHDRRVAAVTGNVDVVNKKKNLLTRMIAARYWNAFNFERYKQSFFGVVNCCTGVFSAYRKNAILPLLKPYLNQTFLGKKQTWGDDRALTTLLLRKHKIVFRKEAMSYTYVPEKLGIFIKQQIRWKKSFIRENLLSVTFMFQRSPALAYEILYTSLVPLVSFVIRFGMVVLIIANPLFIIWFVGMITFMALLRSYYMFMEKGAESVYNVFYAFLHEGIVYWLYFYALLTLTDTKWGTR